MKAASVNEIKKELNLLERNKLVEISLRLAKYKKDNKELLSYLLFDSFNAEGFVKEIKAEVDEQFKEFPKSNLYYTKKTLRKILRMLNKHIKHIGTKEAEADLLIHFCKKIRSSKIPVKTSLILYKLYEGQIKKINKAVSSLNEDLQYDYKNDLEELI